MVDSAVAEVLANFGRTKRAPAEVSAIRVLVECGWARYDNARVRRFLPVLVVQAVIRELIASA